MDVLIKDGPKKAASTPRLAEINVIHSSIPPLEKNMTASLPKEPIMKRLMRWLVPDQRVANRHTMPPVIGCLGLLHTSKEYKIGDVSIGGFFMITEERWIPGTGFPVTLVRTDDAASGQTLTVFSTVVRNGADGVGFTFLPSGDNEQHDGYVYGTTRLDLTKLAQFLKGLPLTEGNAEPWKRAS